MLPLAKKGMDEISCCAVLKKKKKRTQCNNFPDLGDFYKNSRKEPTSTIFAKREYR
jgi:hypothetical protein